MEVTTIATFAVLGGIFILLFVQVNRMNGGGNASSIFAQTNQVLLDENKELRRQLNETVSVKNSRIAQLEGENKLLQEKTDFYERQLFQVRSGEKPPTEIHIGHADEVTGKKSEVTFKDVGGNVDIDGDIAGNRIKKEVQDE